MKKISEIVHRYKYQSVAAIVILFFVTIYAYRCLVTEVCYPVFVERAVRATAQVAVPSGVISVEVVETASARKEGLSGRKTLKEGEGMLFIFPVEGRYGFWMKDMLFPLDIIWLNEEGRAMHIVENVSSESYPEVFTNESAAKYVLEIPAGMARTYGIYLGSQTEISLHN